MLYFEQKLVKWTLNKMFNTIHNCKITRPTWNKDDSYWKEFFIEKRDNIQLSQTITWEIVDRKKIEWIEYLLVKETIGTVDYIKLMWFNWSTYTQVWTTRTASKALTLEKWISARWIEKASWIKIWDAFFILNNKWTYTSPSSDTITYTTNDIVYYGSKYYVSLSWSTWKIPTNKDYWVEYDRTNSWLASWDPDNIAYADEFRWGYLVLKLEKTNIRNLISTWDYIYFYENKSNLQWIATRIEYIENWTETNPKAWLDANNILVYIRWTNKAGSRPQYKSDSSWEVVAVYSEVWECPIIASNNWVFIYNLQSNWNVREVQLLTLDNIEDITTYNWSLFVLNKSRLYYSHTTNQWHSTCNIYPLDYINVRWWEKLVPYWKMMILFWLYNKVITPINWTTWNVWFVSTDLNFENKLYSKNSIFSYMWVLYMIKDNKELLKVNIVSINNIDYQVETDTILEDTKWLIDNIEWEVSMCLDWKDLHIINYTNNKTKVYTYNVEYWHWSTSEYSMKINKILEWKYYWDNLYVIWWNELVEQKLSFVVWTEDLFRLKQIVFLKIILGIESSKLEYFLDIDYEIWWKKLYKTIELNNYPINIDLIDNEWWLWNSLIWTTLLWTNMWWFNQTNWNVISINVWVWKTSSITRFTIRSKLDNWFIYGWSVVWYEINTPEVTELWYKH